MIKDVIKYNEKEYQISTVFIENMAMFETMIFSIKNGIVSGKEVYCYRTTDAAKSESKHDDICKNAERYISEKAIEKYLTCKNCYEWCCTMCRYNE